MPNRALALLLFAASWVVTGLSPAQAANPAANLDQGSNGKLSAPTSPVQWQNGDLNQNNSHFIEGFSVPYRLVLTNLPLGTHNVKIEWDIRDGSTNALDYITHFQRLQPHTFGAHTTAETVDPLLGLGLGSPPSATFAIPAPSSAGSTVAGQPAASFNALPAGERVMTIYNGTIDGISYVSQGSLSAAHSATRLSIDITATNSTVVLAWGGHIASAGDWGHNNSAGSLTGSPYHTRLIELDGQGGNQDRSMKAESVVPPPTCEIDGPGILCGGGQGTYRVTTDGINPTFLWSFITNTSGASFVGSTTLDSVVVNSGTSGAFQLRVAITAENGRTFCDTLVTVNPGPTCSITGPDPVCGGSTNLVYKGAANSGATYLWSISGNGTIAGSTTADSVRVNAGTSGSFTLSLAVSKNGCTSECDKTVTVNPLPACSVTGPDPVCAQATGLTYRTTPVTGATYAWSILGNGTINGPANADSVHVTAGNAGSFTVSVTVTKTGCSSTCEKTVTVNPLPSCAVTGPDPVCAQATGLTYRTTPVTGATYAWSILGNGTINGPANADSVHVTAGNAGSFTISVTVTKTGCPSTCEKTVTVNPVPTCSIEGPKVCESSTNNLYIGTSTLAGSSFQWSISGNGSIAGSATDDSVYVNAGAPGSFTLTLVVAKDGCSSQCEKTVSVRANPSCSIEGPDPVCAGATPLVYRTTPGANLGFQWSITGNGSIIGSTTADSVEVTAGSAGSFKLTLVVSQTNCAQCTSTCDKTVTVNPVPTCSIEGPKVCESSTNNLYVGTSTLAGSSFQWSITGNGSIAGSATNDSVYVNAGSPGSFTLTLVVAKDGCSSQCEKTVSVRANPGCSIEGPDPVCAGATPLVYRTTPGANLNFQWSITGNGTIAGPSTADSVEVTAGSAGSFKLTLVITQTNCAQCTSTCDKTVTVNPLPSCSVTGPDPVCAQATGLTYRTTPVSGATYSWSILGNGTIDGPANADSVHVTAGNAGSFTISVTVSKLGCSSTCEQPVTVNPVPTCSIEGPKVCESSTNNLYVGTSTLVGSSFQWSITGNGSIAGSATNDSVYVNAGSPGSFTLTLVVSKDGCSSQCEKTVSVRANPGCSIEGPDPVCAGATPLVYRTTPGANLNFQWSITGNGSIIGSTTADSVQVTAGSAGSFKLTLVTTQTNCARCTTTCDKTVTVNPDPACSIEGPKVCESSTNNLYVGTSTLAGSSFQWSITGNGSIAGSATNDSVYVNAGSPGSFTLTLVVSKNGCSSQCEKTVSVRANPGCKIDGPDPVCADATPLVYRTTPGANLNFQWSITGNGSIIGSTTADSVQVTAGSAGSFKLTLVVSQTNCAQCTSTCDKTVTVNPVPTCSINGPPSVCPNTTGIAYSATSSLQGSTFAWSITGNGTVAPTSGDAVLVDTSGPGSFTLTVTVSKGGCSSTCSLVVEVRPTRPGFELIGVNDVPCTKKNLHGADQFLRFPNPTTGVGSLVNTFGLTYNSIEGLAVLQGTPPRVFGSNYDRLVSIDPTSGVATDIGLIGFGRTSGIAFQPQTNVLFGITYGSNRLLHINTATGQGTVVASNVITGNKLNDLAFHPDGRLFVITDGTPKLYQIDPVTGAKINKWTVTGTTLVQGMVWSLDGQTLWAVAKRGGFMDLCRLELVGTNANAIFVDPVLHSGFTDIEALALIGTSGSTCEPASNPTKAQPTSEPVVTRLQLLQNVPNPFNPTTTIQFALPQAGNVELSVFDVRGRRVATLFAGHAEAGQHRVDWNGRSTTGERVSSGVYYYTLRTGSSVETRRMLLIK